MGDREGVAPAEVGDGRLHVRLLGGFQLHRGAQHLDVGSTRLAALLAHLCLAPGTPRPRQVVAGLFWPDSTEAQARTNLRQLLHTLRRLLPDWQAHIAIGPRDLRWLPESTAVIDVQRFTELADGVDRRGGIPLLQAAVDAYGGDLLPGVYDDWVLADREALRRRWLDLCARLATAFEGAGQYRAAIAATRRLLGDDPVDEDAHRRLMRLHAACGERVMALQAYHRSDQVLRRELQVAPSAATRDLYRQLVEQPETAALPAADALVGRHQAVAQLHAMWARVCEDGVPHMALLVGDAGIGKTAVAESVLARWAARGAVTATARCYEGIGRLPLAPAATWLRTPALAEGVSGLPVAWHDVLTRLVPELAEGRPHTPVVGAAADDSGSSGPADRRELFDGVLAALTASGRPVAVLLDDLQWADSDTLDLLLHLLGREPGPHPVLVLATVRPDALTVGSGISRRLAGARGHGHVSTVDLAPLDPEASRELAALAAPAGLDPSLVDQVAAESQGNPLFCLEMIRAAESVGRRPGDPVPERVAAVIESRLAVLSDGARSLAAIAAVAGRAVGTDVLLAAADQPEGRVVAALDDLWRHRILADTALGAYDFTHDKLREVVLDGLPPARRRLLHARVGDALGRFADAPAAELARHAEVAGRPAVAVQLLQQAGVDALRLFAWVDAEGHLRRALDLLASQPDGAARDGVEVEVRLLLGSTLVALRGYAHSDVLTCYDRARHLVSRRSGVLPGPVLRGLAIGHLSRCELSTAADLGGRLREAAARSGDPLLQVEAAYVDGVTAHWLGEAARAGRSLRAAIDGYDPGHRDRHLELYAQDPRIVCTSRLAVVHAQAGRGDAVPLAAAALQEAAALGHPPSLAYALTYAVWVDVLRGVPVEESGRIERLHQLAGAHQLGFFAPIAAVLAGWARAQVDPIDGMGGITDGLRRMADTGQVLHRTFALWLLARVHLAAGDPAAAGAALDAAAIDVVRTGQRYLDRELDEVRRRAAVPNGR